MEVIKALPMPKLIMKIDIVFIWKQLVEFTFIGAVGSFHLAIKAWSSGFDVNMADAQVFNMPMEFRLKLMAVICS